MSNKEKIFIDYIDYMDAYRIYRESHEEWTMAYTDSIAEAIDVIREQVDPDAQIVIITK